MTDSFRANFVRKIVRANYRANDPLYGGINDTNTSDESAKSYLRASAEGRSRYISRRVTSLIWTGQGALVLSLLTFAGTMMIVEGNQITGGVVGDLIFTLICALVGFGFFWSVLKTQSQLRWMVRNWNAATLETAKTGWLKEKRRRLGKLASDWEAPDVETARADAFVLFDIARVWFWSQFVRVYIKADYRIGDSLIVGQSVGGIIKWHPAEYVTSGKAGRIMMIVSTLMPLGLGLALLNVSRVTKLSGVMEDPVGFYAWAVMTILSGWFVLGSQAFLRWMLRNWNTKM